MPITPEEVLQQMQRPDHWDGWVPTYSGKGYRPWAEDPDPLSLEDLAYGLAHTYRYGGHSTPPVTVAEHSVLTSQIIHFLWPGNIALKRAGLLHDAAEAVLHDIQAPLRRCIQVVLPSGEVIPWQESDKRVTQNIAKHFGVLPEHLDAPEVHAADILASCFEKRDCPNLRKGKWGLPPIPKEIQALVIQGMSTYIARKTFLDAAEVLGLV